MTDISITGVLPRRAGIGRRELAAAARYFAGMASRRAGKPFAAVSIILQNDAESAAAHVSVMDVAGPTDVITQPFDPMPGEEDGVYGELYVNCDRAVSEGSRRGRTPAGELLLYVAHGMDHLSGADDALEAGRRAMRRRELGWVAAFWRASR